MEKNQKNPWRWSVYLILVAVLLFVVKQRYHQQLNPIWQKIYYAYIDHSLEQTVDKSLQGTSGEYAIAIMNLKTGQTYYKNTHEQFASGSLYKLWIMTVTYQQIQQGKLDKAKQLNGDVKTLNKEFNVDDEHADLTSGTISLTVGSALNQMITISHNYAAMLLTEQVGLPAVTNFLTAHDYTESSVGNNSDPKTTAYDTEQLLDDLYSDKLANQKYTNEMLTLLKNQQLNEKLPKYLPDAVTVAHKTGEIGDYSHDAGIIYTPKGNYIIVVLSKSKKPDGANERIAQLSKAVYDYFIKQKEVNF